MNNVYLNPFFVLDMLNQAESRLRSYCEHEINASSNYDYKAGAYEMMEQGFREINQVREIISKELAGGGNE